MTAGPFEAVWLFSGPVTLVGTDVPQLEIDGLGEGFIGPDSVTQVGPSSLRGDYSSASGIEGGDAWRVSTLPTAIAPALVIPEEGTCL